MQTTIPNFCVMSKYIVSLFILATTTSLFGQNTFKKNDFSFEFAGNGIWASLNYERQLMDKPGLGVRFGIGYFSGDEKFRVSIPIGVNYLFKIKSGKSFIDAGVGATWSGAVGMKTFKQEALTGRDYSEHIWSFVPSIGYRHHTKGEFMWRVSFTPIINRYRFLPFPGLSIGKRF